MSIFFDFSCYNNSMENNFSKIFYSLAMFFCLVWDGFAAQWAVVTVEKATVFSDVQMSSVIGFISRGKKIRVGEVPKNRGRLLPVIINKKIAYIQVDDIAITANKDAIYSATKRIQSKMEEKVDEKKLAIYFGTNYSNFDFETAERNEQSYSTLMINLGFRGYYRKLGDKTGLRSSLNYHTGSKDDEELSWVGISVDYTWPALTSKLYDMMFFVGGTVAPYVAYKVEDLFEITGTGFGAQAGVDMKFDLPGAWSFNVDGSYSIMKVLEMNLPDNAYYGTSINPLINSIGTSVAITYEY